MFRIVLIEPEIPQNTGNIARLCAATDIELVLVGKLGFSIDDKYVKRAAMDYWQYVNVIINYIQILILKKIKILISFLEAKVQGFQNLCMKNIVIIYIEFQ